TIIVLATIEVYVKSARGSNGGFLWRLGLTVNVVPSAASSVCPSGADRATVSAPRLPAAPGRFSTMKGCLSVADSLSAMARATRSTEAPGRKGTTIFTDRCGYEEPAFAVSIPRLAAAAPVKNRRLDIMAPTRVVEISVASVPGFRVSWNLHSA